MNESTHAEIIQRMNKAISQVGNLTKEDVITILERILNDYIIKRY